MDHKPIFLHGLWRAGTTYVWSRFRAVPECYCYYEPLHHGLARLTGKRLRRGIQAPAAPEIHTHPDLSRPYFQEFEPLLAGRGVKAFRKDFAHKRFVLTKEEEHKSLRVYIQSLIDFAHTQDKTPVLGLNRTVLRLPWCKTNFDAHHLYIDRDPREIWWSYEKHRQKGNTTFFTTWLRIIDLNRADPFFAALAQDLGIKSPLIRLKDKAHYNRILGALSQEQTYAMVYHLWRAARSQADSYADTIFDMRQADDAAYLAKIQDALPCSVDFSDAKRVALTPEEQSVIDFASIERQGEEIPTEKLA